jgi:hypothetical protein
VRIGTRTDRPTRFQLASLSGDRRDEAIDDLGDDQVRVVAGLLMLG